MKRSRELGMQTFDQSLFDLYEAGLITYEDALRNADSINDLRLRSSCTARKRRTATSSPASATSTSCPTRQTRTRSDDQGRRAFRRRAERAAAVLRLRRPEHRRRLRARTRRFTGRPRRRTRIRRRSSCTRARARSRSRSTTASTFRCPTSSCACIRPRPRCAATDRARRCCRSASATSTISEVEAVGHYAIRPTFSDGHDTGIYSWDYLLRPRACARTSCGSATSSGWRAAGASRDPTDASRTDERQDPFRLRGSRRADEKAQRVRGVFDSVAGKYDLMNDLMSLGLHRAVEALRGQRDRRARRACACSISPAAPATSRACSPSASAPTAQVVLTDINGAMLAAGRDRMVERGPAAPGGPVRRREAAVRRPAASTASASPSACATSRARTRRSPRCTGCCKPGGVAAVLEFSRVAAPLAPAYDWYSFNVLPRLGKLVAGDDASYRYLAESIRDAPRPGDARGHDGTSGLRPGRSAQPDGWRCRAASGL